MGRALATWMRRRVVEQHLNGTSLAEIARTEGLSYATVRKCWHRYKQRGLEGLAPDYGNCGRAGPSPHDGVYRAARYLKYLHRDWGAPLIHLHLRQRYGAAGLPSVRTLQRWFAQAGLCRRRQRLPVPERRWAQAPHEVWQIDAKEQITLSGGEKACYLTMVDEHSGALLEAPVFPPQPHQSGSAPGGARRPHRQFQALGAPGGHQGR